MELDNGAQAVGREQSSYGWLDRPCGLNGKIYG